MGTLLYLSIRGVQDVIMINVMLMTVHALKKFLKLSCAALPRVSAALPHSGSQREQTTHHSRHEHHTLAYINCPCTHHTIKIEKSYMPPFYPFKSSYQSLSLTLSPNISPSLALISKKDLSTKRKK